LYVFVFEESDAGIETALRLEAVFGSNFGNGGGSPRGNVALRWKHETVKAMARAGMRVPRQVMARSWAEAEDFLRSLGATDEAVSSEHVGDGALVGILKPTRGAASIDVFAVASFGEARSAFDAIMGSDG
jgi:hypothetical protein